MRYCGMTSSSNKWTYEEFLRISNVKYENKNEVNSLIKSLLKINVTFKMKVVRLNEQHYPGHEDLFLSSSRSKIDIK